MSPTNETTDEASGSGAGLIDVEGGYTQQEQLAEIEFVVSVMQEHFGEDVTRLQGGEWHLEGRREPLMVDTLMCTIRR